MGPINNEIALLLSILDEAYERQSWHGPNLRGALRGVTVGQAVWRPGEGRHSIWEIAVHAAYWKYAVSRRLRGEKRGSFPLKGNNWFPQPEEASEAAWRKVLFLLRDAHLKLRQAVAEFPSESLHEKAAGSKVSNVRLIYGAAAHDVYHAGQIQLLKRLS